MIGTRTPYRISFAGGGTDYPAWYLKHGGSVLSATIDRFCYLTVHELARDARCRFRIVCSTVQECSELEEIEHPLIREALRYVGTTRALEIRHLSDLPASSGMGTSSSLAVGLLHALLALQGERPTKRELAAHAIALERHRMHEVVGDQDQLAAAFGGLNRIDFHRNGRADVRRVAISAARLNELRRHLLLGYTGLQRIASGVAASYALEPSKNAAQLKRMRAMVSEWIDILCGPRDLMALGPLLHEGWCLKRSLAGGVSTSAIDQLYARALEAGAIGGKLLGAGGGGFMLLFAAPAAHASVRAALPEFVFTGVQFQGCGSELLLDASRMPPCDQDIRSTIP